MIFVTMPFIKVADVIFYPRLNSAACLGKEKRTGISASP
jgi:hypothetical protein